MGSLERKLDPQKVFSAVIDHLNRIDKNIGWTKVCYEDGRYLGLDEIGNRLDNNFEATYYHAVRKAIIFEYKINWENKTSSLIFKFYRHLWGELIPTPEEIAIFTYESYPKDPLLFQTKYDVFHGATTEDAKKALIDFLDNAETLAKYFRGMQDISLKEYFNLVEKIRKYKDDESIIF